MSTLAKTLLTEAQYLEIERRAEYRSEFFQGEMFAMAGAGLTHSILIMNAGAALHAQFRSRDCFVAPNDLRVRVSKTGLYTYPDLVALCGQPELLDGHRDTLLNPNLIVEVLSPSTEAYDRGRKFEQYQSIDSLGEYLLVSSDRVRVELFTRQSDGRWLLTTANKLEDSLNLQSVGCRLTLADLYQKVDFSV